MNLFSVDLKNQPGELAHLCETLAQRGVNVMLAGVTAGDHGTVVFITSDEEAAGTALTAAGIAFSERPALCVRCPDVPGEAAKFAHRLAEANVNVEALLPLSVCQGEAVLVLCVDKFDDGRAALRDQLAV